jgi:platelet-activating factor acetylhydrolase IB subunit alpha
VPCARHKAIIAYLSSNNLPTTANALRDELNLGDSFDAATSKKYEGLLEKKWTSVVRLQKKVHIRKTIDSHSP